MQEVADKAWGVAKKALMIAEDIEHLPCSAHMIPEFAALEDVRTRMSKARGVL